MDFISHTLGAELFAEVHAEDWNLQTAEDGLDLVGNAYYQGFEGVILKRHHLTPAFFDLKTGLAGEILQKFSNYRMKLIILGDFSDLTSKSLQDFIFESNKNQHIQFVKDINELFQK